MLNENKSNGIIWIIRPGALGDTVLSFPLLRKIELQYKNYHLIFFGSNQYRYILNKFFPGIEFISFDNIDWLPLFNEKFDPSELLYSFPEKIYCILPEQDHFVNNLKLISEDLFFTSLDELCGHHISKQMFYMDNFNIEYDLCVDNLISSNATSKTVAKNNLLIHPGTGSSKKIIEDSFWLKLIDAMESMNIKIILGENDLIPSWLKNKEFNRIKDLEELMSELKFADYYFGLDSGVSHLAGILGVKGFALFKITNPNYWSPVGNIRSVFQNDISINEWSKELL
ncbi:MAG: hypothetical protein COA79_00210 [Planctomycetota bacterium]|nr:MAG: hypothetical protein COA79_00210 [Planctomycetota bacterium]